MKKSLVALAALAATGAFAQSTVTLSGGVSMGFQQATVRDATGATLGQMTRIAGVDAVNSNSFILTAVEDLGGGLKLTGLIQQRLGALNGGSTSGATAVSAAENQNSDLGSGDLYVDVSGGFGSIRAGKFTFASHSSYNAFASRAVTTLSESIAAMGGNNTVAYTTPSFSGLTATLGLTTPGVKIGQDYGLGIRLNYAAGPLSVQATHNTNVNGGARTKQGETSAAVYDRDAAGFVRAPIIGTVSAQGASKVTALAASYDLGMAKLFAAGYRRNTDDPISTALESAGYTASISVPVGAALFKAGLMNNSKNGAALDRTSYGVDYSLSKRTTLIAEFARDKRAVLNDNATNNYFVGVAHTF